MKANAIHAILAGAIIALSGWTLRTVHNLTVEIGKLEQDNIWLKRILAERFGIYEKP